MANKRWRALQSFTKTKAEIYIQEKIKQTERQHKKQSALGRNANGEGGKINNKFDILILFKINIKAAADNENISRLCLKPYIYQLQLAEF